MANGPLVGIGSGVHESDIVSDAGDVVERWVSTGSTCPSRHETNRAVIRVSTGSGSVGSVLRVLVLVAWTSMGTDGLVRGSVPVGLPTCTDISSRLLTLMHPSVV